MTQTKLQQAYVEHVAVRDGDIVIAAQVDDSWQRFARLIGGEVLAGDERFHSLSGRNTHRLEISQRAPAWVAA